MSKLTLISPVDGSVYLERESMSVQAAEAAIAEARIAQKAWARRPLKERIAIVQGFVGALLAMQGGVPGARWQAREQLHLTLRFIGEVDGRDARDLDDMLASIDAPAFDLQLHGVG